MNSSAKQTEEILDLDDFGSFEVKKRKSNDGEDKKIAKKKVVWEDPKPFEFGPAVRSLLVYPVPLNAILKLEMDSGFKCTCWGYVNFDKKDDEKKPASWIIKFTDYVDKKTKKHVPTKALADFFKEEGTYVTKAGKTVTMS